MPRFASTVLAASALVVTSLLVEGCASTAEGTRAGSGRTLIASEEIRQWENQDRTAYDLVQRVRPAWLRSRGSTLLGPSYADVFLNGTRYGDLGSLRLLATMSIEEIEFLDARDATTRYGTGHTGGIIHVQSR